MENEREMCICIGQHFLLKHGANVSLQKELEKSHFCTYAKFVLGLINSDTSEINLIDINWGNPWSKPVKVKNPHAITDKEFLSLIGEAQFIRII
jgi:hypothetical protein